MPFTLSVNTNPLVNRFAEPEDLIGVLAGEIGIGHVQLVHEFINPAWEPATVRRLTRRMAAVASTQRVKITSLMTGPYGRLNHFAHPDAAVRDYYVGWFNGLADIAADLGATAIGTQFGIFTYRDFDDLQRRQALMLQTLECWRRVAEHAARRGLSYLFWEPMSVGRELGQTHQSARELQAMIDGAGLALPLIPMVDIDHGDVTSADPADTDPYAWAERWAARSPIIHIKQSSMNKGGHWPFTAEHNANGRITPEKLLAAIRRGGGHDNQLCLELAFREREPADRSVVAALRQSVAHWAAFADPGMAVATTGTSV